jgi:uracil-DNA glycosylase family 4
VLTERHEGAILTVVAEAPGQWEETLGYPLAGKSGKEFEAALTQHGFTRQHVTMTNVSCCRPPEENYKIHRAHVRKANRARVAKGEAPLLMPHEACRDRLMADISDARALLLMGAVAREAIIGERGEKGFEASRGFPFTASVAGRDIPALATVHPAFVLRFRRWTEIFRSDVGKALRMATGRLRQWTPDMLFFPTPEQLANFLSARWEGLPCYDTETDGLQPTLVNLRCLAVGDYRRVVCVPFRTVEIGLPPWHYTVEQRGQIRRILLDFFADRNGVIGAHNEKYDRTVLEYSRDLQGFQVGRRLLDTVLAHHIVHSEWRHDLGFLSAQYTDNPQHKGQNHDEWTSDYELHRYCMLDVATTSWCAAYLGNDSRLLPRVYENDAFLSRLCRKMSEVGMQLDVAERDRLFADLTTKIDRHQTRVQSLASDVIQHLPDATVGARVLATSVNPGSNQQVGQLLFDVIGIAPAPEDAGGITATGDFSVRSDVLYYLIDRGLPEIVEQLILAIIDYRSDLKLRGTYCTVKPCPDGRVRASWNPHVVVSGRLSCSDPVNLMNLERSVRSMYVAAPGNLFVACDKAQLEARLTAWLSGDGRQIDAFLRGADIHKVNACDILGIPSVDQVTKAQRQWTKTFVYAVQYLASVKKVWQMVRNFVDPATGTRPYRGYTLPQAQTDYERFWGKRKAILAWHEMNRRTQRATGFLADVLHGRRRYFLDGEGEESTREEMANWFPQSCLPADTRILTRQGMVPIGEAPGEGEVWTGEKWAPYIRLERATNEIGELVLESGQILRCDTNHQVLVIGENKYEFRHWDELRPGDRICLSPARPLEFGAELISPETAYWMGYAIGNGSSSVRRNCLSITIGDRKGRHCKWEQKVRLERWLQTVGHHLQKPQEFSGHLVLRVEDKGFRSWWESLGYPWGKDSHHKRVPTGVWSLGLAGREQFLLGYLDADGCANRRSAWKKRAQPQLNICQRDLLADVQILARTIGVETTLYGPGKDGSWQLGLNRPQLSRLGYVGSGKATYTKDLVPRFVVLEFLDRIAGRMVKHHTSVATLLHRMRSGGSTGVYMLPRIARVLDMECPQLYATVGLAGKRPTGIWEPTYTLSVADPGHRYDSEGVISKNCGAADVNDATRRVADVFPWGFDGPHSGIVHQNHDSLIVECRAEHAMDVGARMKQLMYSKIGDMPLPVDLSIGDSYGRLKEVK